MSANPRPGGDRTAPVPPPAYRRRARECQALRADFVSTRANSASARERQP